MASSVCFAQRQNRDSSFDSICITCYQTIASANSAGELEGAERTHHCDPFGEFNFQVEELRLETRLAAA